MSEHRRMVWKLCKNLSALSKALGKERIWVRTIEHTLSAGDRIDIVAQDRPVSKTSPDTTCYVIEVKSDKGDHEILGQLQKALLVMEKIGESTKHWQKTVGIAVAKDYTESGLQILLDAGMLAFRWREDPDSGEVQLSSSDG